ncbi:uncharacterized protein LOC141801656 isoform X2 [Halichoeres trimaculatus]|uniref:uncharacterized protein LOC141801656 isoform X2 n=1 Tax=Halichoeres trimaculatus TaxID=147232 RepID=UPI003D9E70C9
MVCLAVHTDSNSRLVPSLRLEPSATFSIPNSTRGTHLIFGPSAAAVTALQFAQIASQAQVALQQLATLATITVGNQWHNNNRIAAALPPHLALLSLLSRQQVSAVGFNIDTNGKTHSNTHSCLSAAMYHHHSQHQGSQSFSNGPRPPHHQPPPNQHQNRSSSDVLSQAMGFQFPRPTQLPDELESALAIRGARDMDHRLIDHMSRPTQHQNQSPAPVISQHGSFGPNSMALASETQQGVDWSSYQPPTKLFSSPPPGASHQSQRPPGSQQQPQGSHAGARMQSWKTSDSPSPQARHPLGSGENQGMYTPESAGSILASFGLSNEDLEVLSHYPDEQLTPDTLPFILRDIQINKTGPQNAAASASSSSFTSGIQEMPLLPPHSSQSPEVPSLLTVTQTAGKVIDYGHASRAKEETGARKTFKREQLSTERTVKMYPTSLQSSPTPKTMKTERRQVRLEPAEPSKHGDQDYRRTSSDHRKINRSPAREFQSSSKPRNLDRDYRQDAPKPRPASETRKEISSRRPLSSSSGSKLHSSSGSTSKKLPTPTMISDFSAVSPKVYPHTCSLCHTQCDQEKDWVDHINTVNHTAACRDLRNKYPDWKLNTPSGSGQHGSRGSREPKTHSPSQSVSPSVSCSLSPSPPHSKHRVRPPHHRPHERPYLPHHQPRHQRYPGGASHSGLKRTHDESTKFSTDASRHPSSSSRAGHGSKHGPSQSSTKTAKSGTKPGVKATKTASGKAADSSAKPPPTKKKKKVVAPAQDLSVADRLVYLTGIPNDASEQEVTDLVGSFGRINNVILMPCSEEDSEKSEGQKASVCMMKAEDAQALANSTNLSIREQQITATTAQKSGEKKSSEDSRRPAAEADKGDAKEGSDAEMKTTEERGLVLITGLPDGGWSESDIISLVQPFGMPFDIIMATQIGRVLLSVPDGETAQEMVKVHSFRPAKIRDSEVKMTHIKQNIGLSTPVALYNLLMASGAPFDSPAPVGWSSLLVISNVPSTTSGPSEVQKLVRRFGTVIKTLVLNSMVICEMATAAMALSVYKRFQTFPCIIHNKPLFFSRKADPRANTQSKVISAYLDPSEETPANGKSSKTSAAGEEEEEEKHAKEDSGPPLEVTEKGFNRKEEKMGGTEEKALFVGDKALEENQSKDQEQEIPKEELVSESLVPPDTTPERDSETSQMNRAEEEKDGDESTDEREKAAAGDKTERTTPDGGAASKETPVPEPAEVKSTLQTPKKASLETVDTVQEESKTSTVSSSNNRFEAPTKGKQEETRGEKKQAQKPAPEPQQPSKNQAEDEAKKQERELKEKEARKERDRKDREKKERERRAWESKERARKERERDERARRERERREEERREREKRERKRMHSEGSTGRRSSSRSEGNKQNSERDGQNKKPEAAVKKVEEEEDFDQFPFNMSDFVTVDEVGDVADLPDSPPPPPPATVFMEKLEGEAGAASSVQRDVSEETPAEGNTEPHTTAAPVGSDGHEPEPEAVTEQASSTPDQLSDSPNSQTLQTYQPAAPETDQADPETQRTILEVDPLPMPADCSSNSPEVVIVKGAEEEHDAFSKVNKDEEGEEPVNKTEESRKTLDEDEEDDKARAVAAQTGKHKRPDDNADPEEESVRKKLRTEMPPNTDHTLPPFDPSSPVGLEFLVPKTGFFCRACNRFFSGNKEAEISHCKTLKHYQSLQKFLQTRKTVDVSHQVSS